MDFLLDFFTPIYVHRQFIPLSPKSEWVFPSFVSIHPSIHLSLHLSIPPNLPNFELAYYQIRFWQNSTGNFFWWILLKVSDFSFKVMNASRNECFDWRETKRKCIGWISDLDLYPHPWPWLWIFFFKFKFRSCCFSGNVYMTYVKQKGGKFIKYSAKYMTLLLNHTHDLDLDVSRSKFKKALFQEREGWLTWKWVVHSGPGHWPVLLWWGGWMYQVVTSTHFN